MSDQVKKFLERVKNASSGAEVAAIATSINPLSDPQKVLEILIDAITYVQTDSRLTDRAVKQTIYQYPNKYAVFSMATANTQLRRIFKMIQALDRIEKELDDRSLSMDDENLIRTYSAMQTTLLKSLEYVKDVAALKLSMQDAKSISQELDQMNKEADVEEYKLLTPQKRNRIRQIIDVLKSTGDIQIDGGANNGPTK
jgi:hypothetical protein